LRNVCEIAGGVVDRVSVSIAGHEIEAATVAFREGDLKGVIARSRIIAKKGQKLHERKAGGRAGRAVRDQRPIGLLARREVHVKNSVDDVLARVIQKTLPHGST